MPRFLTLAAVTRTNRLIATDAAKDAIADAGGWIDDFQMFSNKMTTIRCPLPTENLGILADRLEAAGIHLDQDSRARMDLAMTEPREIVAALSLTFIHDEPDLVREMPAVPG